MSVTQRLLAAIAVFLTGLGVALHRLGVSAIRSAVREELEAHTARETITLARIERRIAALERNAGEAVKR